MPPSFPVTQTVRAAMQSDTRVSGNDSTTIDTKVEKSVIRDWKRLGTVFPIT